MVSVAPLWVLGGTSSLVADIADMLGSLGGRRQPGASSRHTADGLGCPGVDSGSDEGAEGYTEGGGAGYNPGGR